MFCRQCGASIQDGAKFCSKCGAAASPSVQSASQGRAASSAQPYAQPAAASQVPVNQVVVGVPPLKTDWSWIIVILLSLVTFGIYGIYFWYKMSKTANLLAPQEKPLMNYIGALLLGVVTLSIYLFYWMYKLTQSYSNTLNARGCVYNLSTRDFWLWEILGSLIIVGPFIYLNKLCTACNMVSEDYNRKGR